MYVLVKMSFDYSDEFDVDSFLVIKKEEWESIYSNIKKLLPEYPTQEFKDWKDRRDYEVKNSIEDIECYFGTNEQVMFKYIDDFNNGIKIHSITEDQAKRQRKQAYYGAHEQSPMIAAGEIENIPCKKRTQGCSHCAAQSNAAENQAVGPEPEQ